MKDLTNHFILYFRVSTEAQDLDTQKRILRNHLKEEWICKEFYEIVSGRTMSSNKQLNEAIEYCKNNGKTIAVAKLDRLGRDLAHAAKVHKELKGNIYAPGFGGPGEKMNLMVFSVLMAAAQAEREWISERTKEGQRTAKEKGVVFGRKRPWTKKEMLLRNARDMETKRRKKVEDPKYMRILTFVENRVDAWVEKTGKRPVKTVRSPSGAIYQEIANELNELKFEIPDSMYGGKTSFTAEYVAKLYYNERTKIQIPA